ncbi:hypothetical protein CDAR_227431 [Caerostris darwini]|uniref:Uncharacterized protein n=1 Tax=Caerostris darwini TaxID=1538125 RepID=A0AAV4ULX3_9ARAC|nr:hypothetical protein CDAR_227431 [Caerostris darwini]
MIYQNRFRKFPFPCIDAPIKDFPNSSFYRFSSSHTPLFIVFQKGCTSIPTCITKRILFSTLCSPPLNQLQDYSSIYASDAYCRHTLIGRIDGRGVAPPSPNLEQFMINWHRST